MTASLVKYNMPSLLSIINDVIAFFFFLKWCLIERDGFCERLKQYCGSFVGSYKICHFSCVEMMQMVETASKKGGNNGVKILISHKS